MAFSVCGDDPVADATVKKSSLGRIQDFPSLTVGVLFVAKYLKTEP